MITHELIRELVKIDLQEIQVIAEFVPTEVVFKALIIREFMNERAIEDSRQGIREFYNFERDRLHRLGFTAAPNSAARQRKSASVARVNP